MAEKNPRIFDRRTIDRYMERGDLKKDEFEKHIKTLPDSADEAQYVQMDLYEAEMSDGADDEEVDDTDDLDTDDATEEEDEEDESSNEDT